MFSSATYSDAYNAALQAAADAFGGSSTQVNAVANAWYAVGVIGYLSTTVTGDDTATFGSTHTYSAYPNASCYTYYWEFDGNNNERCTQVTSGNTNTVTFPTSGGAIWDLWCTIYDPLGQSLGSGMIEILVSTSYYSVSTSTNSLTVQLKTSADAIETQTVNYELSNLQNTAVKRSGQFDKTGTVLDVSSLPKGIYVMRIKIKTGVIETFKVIVH